MKKYIEEKNNGFEYIGGYTSYNNVDSILMRCKNCGVVDLYSLDYLLFNGINKCISCSNNNIIGKIEKSYTGVEIVNNVLDSQNILVLKLPCGHYRHYRNARVYNRIGVRCRICNKIFNNEKKLKEV